MSEHTPTPWAYRPQEHDDWGWIRDADGNLAATARDGRVWSEHFDRYRAAKTDPYEPNAAFIVKAVNNHDALVAALSELYAQVRGECPSLLNEDSGGDARLDLEIKDILASVSSQKDSGNG